jgi:hypothetical protein
MDDFEIRKSLIAICETLKIQAINLSSLHRSTVKMYEAAKNELPNFELAYDSANPEIKDYPGSAELLRQVDSLLAQLKKA